MLKTLQRYVLLDVIQTCCMTLAGLTAIMILGIVARQAAAEGLPLTHVARLIPFAIPESLRYTIPATMLLAVTSVYSKLAGNNEITAIKATGISPWSVIWPVLVLAFLLSLVAVWVNDVAVSWGRAGMARVFIEGIEEIAYSTLRTKKSFSSPRFTISVHDVQGRRLIQPTCTITQPPVTITAEEARLVCDHEREVLRISSRNGEMEWAGDEKRKFVFQGWEDLDVPLTEASRTQIRSDNPSETPLSEISAQVEHELRQIVEFDRELATRATLWLSFGQFDALDDARWSASRERRQEMVTRLNRLYAEPYRRWAAGFSCFFFVWLGIPMAIWQRKSDFLTSFFICFAPILVIYYPLLMFGADAAKNGILPPWSVWAGNLVLLIAGAIILRKVMKH